MITLPNIIKKQRTFFQTDTTRDLNYRLSQLTKLEQAIRFYEEELTNAFWQDLQ